MIKFCHHAVQNIFLVRLLDGFVKLSQMYGCSSFLICCYNKHYYWSNLVEKRISSILQITLHYQGKSSHDLKIESNRDTVLTDFSQAHLQRPCLYSPGPLAQRWYCSQCVMLYYINYQSAITPQKCCQLHTSQQLQQLLRTQSGWVQNRLKFMDARGNSVCSSFEENFGSRVETRSDAGRVLRAYGEIHNSLRKNQQGNARWYKAIPDPHKKSPSLKYQFHRGKGQFNPSRIYTPNWTLHVPSLKEKR